ncbi:MAG: CDC27 family protein, partial [Rhabdochlamydiaceae bacterium]
MKLILCLLAITSVFGADICLSLVVRNDESSIEACLKSVKDTVDCISVCDAGSTDRTVEIIQQFMRTTGIPGKIDSHPWKNWGHNRTLAVDAARKTLSEKGFNPADTYLLILDANKILSPGEGFTKESLKKDAYLLLERSSLLSCYSYNLNLLKASISWKSSGVAHEYWSSEGPYQCEKLRTLMIYDQVDDRDRVKEEIRLMKEEPDNERYMFYIAQSLKSLKQYEEAIRWYKKRINYKGDSEEVWFSKYMLGECYKELGNWETALFWLLEAYQYNPDRTDSLLSIATYYRLHGQNDLSYIFASYGLMIPSTDEQIFFNSPPGENYRFDEERSIVAYYTRFREEGFQAADKILLTRGVPWNVRHQTYKNIEFYIQPLPNARFMPIEIDFPLIEEGLEERYHPMNPSIIKTNDGYKVICRSVNYTQTGAKIYHTNDKNGIFRTKNFLIHYDKNFNVISQNEIVENLARNRVRSWIADHTKGLDDCRIFEFNGRNWFTCTTSDTNPTGNYQISLCRLSEDKSGDVDQLVPLLGPDPNRCEKNWAPIVIDHELMLIYSYDPFIVYKPNLSTGRCDKVFSYNPSHDLSSLRGSTPPIIFDGGYLILVHEVSHMDDHTRRYYHRFVYLSENFTIQKVSKPFIFKHSGIEFSCGMTLNHAGNELIIGVGIEDNEAYLCRVDIETI